MHPLTRSGVTYAPQRRIFPSNLASFDLPGSCQLYGKKQWSHLALCHRCGAGPACFHRPYCLPKEAQAFSDLIAQKTGQLQVRTDALVLYSPNERGYWHNAEGWTGNPLEATLYDSADLTPATIAAVQLSAPGTIAVSLFDAEVTDLDVDPPPAYPQPAIERVAELVAA
ncbi:MAG: hypothetical protein EOP14_03010 [Pseudomonas sp.]|nr:MAG: hypothetical protein EOP14_03010 [Pseudomonas sp.]